MYFSISEIPELTVTNSDNIFLRHLALEKFKINFDTINCVDIITFVPVLRVRSFCCTMICKCSF